MFGFGKKKEPPARPDRKERAQSKPQLEFLAGLDNNGITGLDEDDADLEDELLMLLNEDPPIKPSRNAKASAPKFPEKKQDHPVTDTSKINIDPSLMADDDAVEDEDVNDEDLNDPELQAELSGLIEDTPEETEPDEEQIPQQLLVKIPIKPVQKETPLQVSFEKPLAPRPPSSPVLSVSSVSPQIKPGEYAKSNVVCTDPKIEERLNEYKRMAVSLKKIGDMEGAKEYFRLFKALDAIQKSGDSINWNDFPPLPDGIGPSTIGNDNAKVTKGSDVQPKDSTSEINTEDATQSNVKSLEDIFKAPPAPTTILEALQQRLAKYESETEKASASGNSSKARRMGRIVKQYEEALVLHRKGRPVAFDELPTPPGFGPIPGIPSAAIAEPGPTTPIAPSKSSENPHDATATDDVSPEKRFRLPNASFGSASSPSQPQPSIQRIGKQVTKLTLQEKQLSLILQRQNQFKEAALNAKKRGDTEQALEFLRTAKGFDKLIQVSQAGLPVDMSSLPSAPDAVAALEDETFEIVGAADCIQVEGSAAEVFAKLEDDLKSQIKLSMSIRDHFKKMGEVASSNRFESYALESKRDLDTLRLAARRGTDFPKYHYENRMFSVTECNSDLTEDEIEICVVQGVNLKVPNPSDVDTFVRVELPYPSAEEAQSQKSHVVKDTNNPSYNVTYKMNINRKARNFQRFVHRHGVKIEVWSKGGFFKTSSLIGTAVVKLIPLESKCTLHDAFEVMEGRKAVGKLEVKIRLRDPVVTKEITQQKRKWLYIDKT